MPAIITRGQEDSRTVISSERRAASQADARIDAELVRRCKLADDEDAFAEIVCRHRDRIFSLVLGSVHNRADAEEITSDTFVRAHRGLKNFRGDSSLATWLHHIAVNLARNRYWFLFRRRELAAVSLDAPLGNNPSGTLADVVASDAIDPSQAMEQRESAAIIQTCLDRLPEKQREVLRLRGVLDRSYVEIARALGINVGTVKSRIARARTMLRRTVEENGCELASTAG